VTHSPTLLILDALAVFRLTRLVVLDAIADPIRRRLLGSRPGTTRTLSGERVLVVARPRLAEFLACPWCVSIWAAVAIVALQAFAATACVYVTAVLAFSAVAGLLADRS